MEESPDRDLGPQPLDTLLDTLGIDNHRLVAASTEQLTHKQVQKARKGRRISRNSQQKILKALNAIPAPPLVAGEGAGPVAEAPEKHVYMMAELFNYPRKKLRVEG